MKNTSYRVVVILILIIATVANVAYYETRMRQLNSIPLPAYSPSDQYVIASQQAAHDRALSFWIIEGVIAVACGALFALGGENRRTPDN